MNLYHSKLVFSILLFCNATSYQLLSDLTLQLSIQTEGSGLCTF